MLTVLKRKDNTTLVAGTITEIREGVGAAAGRAVFVTITGEDWSREAGNQTKTVELAFWNPEDPEAPDYRRLADRIRQANLETGSFISALVHHKDDTHATVLRYRKKGIWNFPANDDENEINVIIGTVASLKKKEDGKVICSVPVYQGSGKDTKWVYITFRNNERSNRADRAVACLSPRPEHKANAVIICGALNEFTPENQAEPMHFYPGFQFTII